MVDCLYTLHMDITMAWNFYDPSGHLSNSKTRALMSRVIEDLTRPSTNPAAALVKGLTGAATVTGVSAAIFPLAAAVVGPVAGAVVFAKWVYDLYKRTPSIICCLMGYIVDLIFILKRLFWLMRRKGGIQPIDEGLIQEVIQEFLESQQRLEIHREITQFVEKAGLFHRAVGKDYILDKIVELVRTHCKDSSDVFPGHNES